MKRILALLIFSAGMLSAFEFPPKFEIPRTTEVPGEVIGWKSARALKLGPGYGFSNRYREDFYPFYEFTLAQFGAGLTPPIGLGIWVRLWISEIMYSEPIASVRLSYTPWQTWKHQANQHLGFTRLDLFLEPGFTFLWYEDWMLRAGASFFASVLPYMLPIDIEAGCALTGEMENYSIHLMASASLLGYEQPIKKKELTEWQIVHQFSSTDQGLPIWAGFEFLGVGLTFLPENFRRRESEIPELCAAKIGFGLAPPIGLGIWTRIWAGALSDWWKAMPLVTMRLTYSPFMAFKESKLGHYRTVRIDLFAEPGLTNDNTYTFRTGISSTFSFIPLLAPITVEAGWASLPVWSENSSGFYALISTSAFGGDFVFSGTPLQTTHAFSTPEWVIKPWVAVEGPSGATGFMVDRVYDFLAEEHQIHIEPLLEASFVRVGIGMSAPVNLGLWGSMGYFSEGSGISARLTYSPWTAYQETSVGLQRRSRVDLFAETGANESGRWVFKTGLRGSFKVLSWLPDAFVETGWASCEFLAYEVSAPFLQLGLTSVSIDHLFTEPAKVKKNFRRNSDSLPSSWIGFEIASFRGGAAYPVADAQSDDWITGEFTIVGLGAGFDPPIGAGIWGKILINRFLEHYSEFISLRGSWSPAASWQEINGKLSRRSRWEIFAEASAGLYNNAQFKGGIAGKLHSTQYMLPVSVELGYGYNRQRVRYSTGFEFIHSTGPYLQISTSLLGGEFPLVNGVDKKSN